MGSNVWVVVFGAPALLAACNAKVETSDGMGAPCLLADESQSKFGGFNPSEVYVQFNTPGCATGLCVADRFRGRVSCPGGQTAADLANGAPHCFVAGEGGGEPVTVPVAPQCADRPASEAVYCSCMCDAAAPNSPLCACPDGFECRPAIPGADQSFCFRAAQPSSMTCSGSH